MPPTSQSHLETGFALAGSGHGDGSSIVDVLDEDLLKSFGE
ncbi:MAG TPA: hypothetical protein VK680_08150 [Solirubrobacteraceae bacterium]|nr:hypothetical protein [Solirubrobacteraceae bacterium]